MGWFSKKPSEAKLQGAEAGQLAKLQVCEEFILTEYYSNGIFNPPPGFFKDPYIVGFLHGYTVTMADVSSARRRKEWTQQEATEFMISAMEKIVGPQNLNSFIGEPRKCQNLEEYKDAYFAANTLIKSIFASSALTEENTLVREANNLIEERRQFLSETFSNSPKGEILAWGIKEISIKRHIQSVYLQQ